MAVEAGVQRGLKDIEAGRYFELTDEAFNEMLEEFEANYQSQP